MPLQGLSCLFASGVFPGVFLTKQVSFDHQPLADVPPEVVLLLLSSVYAGCVGWLTGGLLPGFVSLTLSESYSPFGTPLVFEMGEAGAGNW